MEDIKCPICNSKRFNAFKFYCKKHKVEINEKGTVIVNHDVSPALSNHSLVDITCRRCGEFAEEEE